MKTFRISAILLIAVLIASGCKKEEIISNRDLLSAEWKVSKVIIDGAADTKDYSAYRFTFNKDETYIFSDPPVPGMSTQGIWEFPPSARILYMTPANGTELSIPVNKLTEENAELVFTIPATFKSSEKTAVYFLEKN